MLFHAGESRFISVQGQQFEGVATPEGYVIEVPDHFRPHMEIAGMRALTNEGEEHDPALIFVRANAKSRAAVEMERGRQLAADTPWAKAFPGAGGE